MYITPDMVRLFMMDRTADENFLLDSVEFTDTEISDALVLVVDKYNTMLPHVDYYTADTFPYRTEALAGVAGMLMKMKALNMVRNNLDYNTSDGTAISDKGKKQEYLSLAQAFEQEFDTKCRSLKVSKNSNDCYGYV